MPIEPDVLVMTLATDCRRVSTGRRGGATDRGAAGAAGDSVVVPTEPVPPAPVGRAASLTVVRGCFRSSAPSPTIKVAATITVPRAATAAIW